MTIERTFDVTFEVYCSRLRRTVANGICNSRPLTWQEALQMFHVLNMDRSLWPAELLTLPEYQTPEFNYTEAGSSNSNLAKLNKAWNKGPVSRPTGGPSLFPIRRSNRDSQR
jgi:hypothetical protein